MIIKRCEMNNNDSLDFLFHSNKKTKNHSTRKEKPHRGEERIVCYNSVVIGCEWFDGKVINEWRGWAGVKFLFVDWTIVDVALRTFDWLNVRVTITGGATIGGWWVLPSP